MSFPLSRIFHADPEGHNAGWVLHLQYGTDRAKASDARKGNGLVRTDLDTVSLTYKMNSWVSFINETSYIDTHAASKKPLHAGRRIASSPGIFSRSRLCIRCEAASGISPLRQTGGPSPSLPATPATVAA